MKRQLRVGTRRSILARTQTGEILERLKMVSPQVDIQVQFISTIGDQTKGPLPTSKPGVFTSTLDKALLGNHIDFAVHSFKDLPVKRPQGLTIAAIPERVTAFDVLVTKSGLTLDALPQGATVGTSSLRRTAQLLSMRSDLNIVPLRGNVDTRVEHVLTGQIQAALLAEAGLRRLGVSARYMQRIPLDMMLPAPAQGALAVECRRDDPFTVSILETIDVPATRTTITAERTFLADTGGGCAIPIGAYAEHTDDGIHLQGEVLSPDGHRRVRVSGDGSDAEKLGRQLAGKANFMGAKKILQRE